MAVPPVPLVLRADPRDRMEVPQPSRFPMLLAAFASLCLVAGFAGRQWWIPGHPTLAAAPHAQAGFTLPVAASPTVVQAAAPAPRALQPPASSATARAVTPRSLHARVRHAAARLRAPHPGRLHAGRRNGEGRA